MKISLFIVLVISFGNTVSAQSFTDVQVADAWSALTLNDLSPTATMVQSKAADSEAVFPGGDRALQRYLAEQMHYPQQAIENGIEGTVRVRFKVDEQGKTQDPVVVCSLHRLVDREVIQLIRKMPDWSPRVENGVAVESYVEIPVDLALR